MAAPAPDSEKQGEGKSKILVVVMAGLVLASILTFLMLRPNPSGTGHPTSTASHAPPQ